MLRSRLAVVLVVGAPALIVANAHTAQAQEREESVAAPANRGFKLGFAPTLLLPFHNGGPYGGGARVEGRYGIQVGPTVLAPGGRLDGYVISSRVVGTAMPTFRVTLPVGPFAPYVVGGVGAGFISNDAEAGLALLGGGGLAVHIGHVVALGAEATYQVITGTEFSTVAIGPSISFGG